MIIKAPMMYLGLETKVSQKSGKSYLLVKMMEKETSSIYEFYVPSDKLALITALGQQKQFTEVKCVLGMSSFNNKPQIDLDGIENK